MPKPTVVLVHGAWADGSSWNAVSVELQAQGFTVLTPPNLLRGVAADSAYLASFLAQRTTGPVVLVGHSYGGVVVTNAGAGGSFALYLRAPGHQATRVAHTDEAGKFRADGVPPGRYEAFAVIVRGAWYQSSGSEFAAAWPLGPVQVTLGEKNSLEARLPEPATLNLRMTSDLSPSIGPWGRWVWQAHCRLSGQSRQVTITTVDGAPFSACEGALTSSAWISNPDMSEGTISLELPPGRYRLSFASAGFEPAETVVQLEARKGTAAKLAVKPSVAEPRPR